MFKVLKNVKYDFLNFAPLCLALFGCQRTGKIWFNFYFSVGGAKIEFLRGSE